MNSLDDLLALECLSPHLPRLLPDGRRLPWIYPWGARNTRVITWTCDCMAMVYELCQAGGQGFIRRTLQDESRPEVRETHRWQLHEAHEIWALMLTGRAR